MSSGNYSSQNANSQGVKPPNNLYCFGCDKEKPIRSFSKTQITKCMSNIYNPYAPRGRTTKKHYATCKRCTPQQNIALTCMICTHTKILDEFSKAQRKNAEKAVCFKCMKKLEEDDIDDSSLDDDSDDCEYNETWNDIM
jgi:hypothetical protein